MGTIITRKRKDGNPSYLCQIAMKRGDTTALRLVGFGQKAGKGVDSATRG